jgi:hypothetical protein
MIKSKVHGTERKEEIRNETSGNPQLAGVPEGKEKSGI